MRNKAKNCKRWKRKTNRKIRQQNERRNRNPVEPRVAATTSSKHAKDERVLHKLQRNHPIYLGSICIANNVFFFSSPLFLYDYSFTATTTNERDTVRASNSFQLFYRNENNRIDHTTERQFRLPLRRSDAIGTASCFFLLFRSCARVNFYLEFIAPKKKGKQQQKI